MNQTIEIPVWLALLWPAIWLLLGLIEGWRLKLLLRLSALHGLLAAESGETDDSTISPKERT